MPSPHAMEHLKSESEIQIQPRCTRAAECHVCVCVCVHPCGSVRSGWLGAAPGCARSECRGPASRTPTATCSSPASLPAVRKPLCLATSCMARVRARSAALWGGAARVGAAAAAVCCPALPYKLRSDRGAPLPASTRHDQLSSPQQSAPGPIIPVPAGLLPYRNGLKVGVGDGVLWREEVHLWLTSRIFCAPLRIILSNSAAVRQTKQARNGGIQNSPKDILSP